VKAKRGDALLFYSLTPAGDMDKSSLHAGCPVTKGVKFSATKWIRVGEHQVWNGYAARKAELEAGRANA
jgi:prolyl 4-hydroxylase